MDDGAQATSIQQQTNDGSPIGKLPTELWLIILNMVIDSSIIRLERSPLLAFPYETDFTRPPGYRTDLITCRRRLALVCRTFNALLASSPHFFMGSGEKPIPPSTKALYFDDYHRDLNGIPLLSPQTSVCERLVYINAACTLTERVSTGSPMTFDVLCELSPSLPSIRGLALRLRHQVLDRIIEISFWTRLSHAFPELRTLEASLGYSDRRYIFLTKPGDKVASFKRLEALYLNWAMTYTPIVHPNLRRVIISESALSVTQLTALTCPPLLESIFLRDLQIFVLDVTALAHLRLLGVMMRQISTMIALSPNHPLEHLWIFVDEPMKEATIKRIDGLIQEKTPGILQVTFDSTSCPTCVWFQVDSTVWDFYVYSPVWRVSSGGPEDTTITLQRIPAVPQLESAPVPIGSAEDSGNDDADRVLNETAAMADDGIQKV